MRQVLVVLKQIGNKVLDRYEDERTSHSFDVVVLPEQDPTELIKHEGLLPLATLCRAESGEGLLREVAERISRIESRERRREALNWSRVLAGLRYDKSLIYRILKENDMLEESVVYQDIYRKGAKHGLQEGAEQEARKLVMRQLELKFGKLSQTLRRQIERFEVKQLEALGEALLKFRTKDDLARWLERHTTERNNGG